MKKGWMMFCLILVFPLISSTLDDELIAYYNFDETSGFLMDQTVVGLDRTLAFDGDVLGADLMIPGVVNYSYYFHGGYIHLDNSNHMYYGGNISFSFWIKVNETNGSMPIITKRGNECFGGCNDWEVDILNNKLSVTLWGTSTPTHETPFLSTNEWKHIVITHDGSKTKIYIDNSLVYEANNSGNVNGDNPCEVKLAWNGFQAECARHYNGLLDELGIWNRALTVDEVSELYNQAEFGNQEEVNITICGDGIINQANETCDDGNKVNGDGCSSICIVEQDGSSGGSGGGSSNNDDNTNNDNDNVSDGGNTSNSDNTSGGSNGGGTSNEEQEEDCEAWYCTEWSQCINEIQTRDCKKLKFNCINDEAPRLTKSCGEKDELNPHKRIIDCPEECTCSGSTIKCMFENGTRVMTINAGNSGNIIVQIKNVNMSTNVTLYKDNEGKVYGVFKGNKTSEVILPDKIKENLQKKAKIYDESINLTDDGYYNIEGKKKARLFFIIPVKEKVRAEVNAETGETIKIRNPWWGFLARDVREKNNSKD